MPHPCGVYRQRLLTPTEAAALLQVSPAVIKREIRQGDLVARRLGNEYRAALPDLARFLNRCITLHKCEAGASEAELLAWIERAVERLRPRYSPPEMQVSRSGGESFNRDQ
jgi:excisionase family DNA binding protein